MDELRRFALFDALSGEGRKKLERNARFHRFPASKTVLEKGQKISGAYFVLAGHLRVYALLPDGKEATLYLVRQGETCVLALNSLFNDLLYPAWVRTGPATSLAIIPGGIYRSLFETESAIRDLTVHAFSTVVFRLMSELDQVHSCTLQQRLANFLLTHASRQGTVRHTQQEIASYIGTSREVVARILSQMAGKGLIKTRRGEITILRPKDLVKL